MPESNINNRSIVNGDRCYWGNRGLDHNSREDAHSRSKLAKVIFRIAGS